MAAVRARPDEAGRYLAAQFAQAVHGLIPFAQLPRDGLAHVRADRLDLRVLRGHRGNPAAGT
jgi:hypothetical protein